MFQLMLTGSYEKARDKCKKSEQTSNLESDQSEIENSRRVRKRYCLFFFGFFNYTRSKDYSK